MPNQQVHVIAAGAAKRELSRSTKDVRIITLEIGLLGRSGLDIKDPARRYRLRSMPGDFSGLQLAAYMFVGLRQIAPDTDAGIDFTAEYRLAAAMREAHRGRPHGTQPTGLPRPWRGRAAVPPGFGPISLAELGPPPPGDGR